MTGSIIGTLILWLIIIIIVIAVAVYFLNWLYHRSTKEVAFVRTGFGGEHVVINGGALVIPIAHEATPVNLNVVRIPVTRTQEDAVITRDRMRVDIQAEFFVRVIQEKSAVAMAASTLGSRTMNPDSLAELLGGKFVGALRSVAAELSLDEMHERRGDFVRTVEERAAEALARNGLELESVAITDLDQTDLEFFNPSNRFDAEGLTELIEKIESRRSLRNDVEQSSMLAIRTRNLEAEKETLRLEKESEQLRLAQEKELEAIRAEQRAGITSQRIEQEAQAEQARIKTDRSTREYDIQSRQAIEDIEIKMQRDLEQTRIEQEQTVQAARIARDSRLRQEEIRQRHEIETSEITASEDIERAKIVSERQLQVARVQADEENQSREIVRNRTVELARIEAQQHIEQSRIGQEQQLDTARIDRDRLVRTEQISQRRQLEESEISAHEEIERARIASDRGLEEARILKDREIQALEVERSKVIELAQVERAISLLGKQSEEAQARSETAEQQAKTASAEEKVITARETEVAERIGAIDRLIASKDADTSRIAAETRRISETIAAEAQRLQNEAENLLDPDARAGRLRAKLIDRLEGIVRESVRPMENIEGIKILHVDGLGGGSDNNSHRSPTDEVIESALRYRAQAPLIDQMMKEIGIENANVSRMGDVFRAAKDAQSIARGNENPTTVDSDSSHVGGSDTE